MLLCGLTTEARMFNSSPPVGQHKYLERLTVKEVKRGSGKDILLVEMKCDVDKRYMNKRDFYGYFS